jgi:putative protein kinase ArgK-like GTPase of G3E family
VRLVWDVVSKFQNTMQTDIQTKRVQQSNKWMWSEMENQLKRTARERMETAPLRLELEAKLEKGEVSPRLAGKLLLREFLRAPE